MRALLLLAALGCDADGGSWGGGGTPGGGGGGGGGGDDTADTADTGGSEHTGETGDSGAPEGTGYQEGDVAYDLAATDQDGEDWTLYAQQGQEIVLLTGHMDFGPTQQTMETLLELSAAFPDVLVVALIGRDELSIAAGADDAARWVEDYGLDTALIDPFYNTVNLWSEGASAKTYVIGPQMEIRVVVYGPATLEQLAAGLQG